MPKQVRHDCHCHSDENRNLCRLEKMLKQVQHDNGYDYLYLYIMLTITHNTGYIYILTTENNKVMYIGVTSNLTRRVFEHKTHIYKGFTNKYNVTKLVYYEEFPEIEQAIAREKQLKNWHREWKNQLVESMNPNWIDLSETIGITINEPKDLSFR